MSMRFSLETVTFSEWSADGFLGIQTDPQGDGSSAEVHHEHQFGFISRSWDPDEDGTGCYALKGSEGSEDRCWLAHDPRSNAWLPRVKQGGSAQYGGAVGRALTWREIDGETGSVIDYIPVDWDDHGNATAAHKIEAGVDGNGKPVLQLIHSEGMAIIMYDGAVTITDATGSAFISFGGGKASLSGPLKATSGLDVGGAGGVEVPLHPALVAALTAYNAAVQAAVPAPPDGGAAVLGVLKSATAALLSAVTAGKSTMLKTL